DGISQSKLRYFSSRRHIVGGIQMIIKSISMRKTAPVLVFCLFNIFNAWAQKPKFKVIALYENGGHHIEYSKVAKVWLDKLAADSNFSIDYIQNTDKIDEAFLSNY